VSRSENVPAFRVTALAPSASITDAVNLFAREDYVEEAWRIVNPILKADTAVHEYEPNIWGPAAVDQTVSPATGWHNPVAVDEGCGTPPKAA
jgi:Glucose-6-phosphate dehydrogenase, C-terminal domain